MDDSPACSPDRARWSSQGLGKAFWEGTQQKGPRDGKRKGWDKEAQSSRGWGGGRELSGTEGRALLHRGFQDVPGLRGTVTPADPSECVWTERQEAGAG